MGFSSQMVEKLLEHVPIEDVNQAVEYLIKDEEGYGWKHKFVAQALRNSFGKDPLCEICNDLEQEHMEFKMKQEEEKILQMF
mmetsp:Transcript_11023/g.11114  ORF Transcript_11023/g.11114 Transcript_11023/m.11114 type:complete len:82 (-) Transcript_11023:13-258(-)|eukprot:CAMPEP_0170559940 /NCGR_PEP_ID=MMETSP0211-20121228/46042_1 /TAXON_ID=311385 /ORGANISM="Pseudokeronopsis sp., Strain OXSARD2" /LENGTH=81 /DNA_ID=CAMNT_0010873589 /DNA_START=336 /DNA_END=581 /DNA_ORIENTATION=-